MVSNPSVKKFVHMSEESLAPLYGLIDFKQLVFSVNNPTFFAVHFVVGNDYYVLTQQDVRKIEDTRFLILNKLDKNGNLNSIDSTTVTEYLLHLLKNGNVSIIWQQRVQEPVFPQPMEVTTPTKCAIEQQLKWDKCINTSVPFSFTYSRGTSTSDLCICLQQQNIQSRSNNCSQCGQQIKKVAFSCGNHPTKSSSTSCLSAREQLKQKKMQHSYIS